MYLRFCLDLTLLFSNKRELDKRRKDDKDQESIQASTTPSLNIFYLINSLHVYKQEHAY